MAKQNIASVVEAIVRPVAEGLGYVLWSVEFTKVGSDWHLIVTIDTEAEGGINIEDCERVHRAIDPLLDEADPIEGSYSLEVSSPGIERNLLTDTHIAWAVGQKVEVKLFAAEGGRKTYRGTLVSYQDKKLEIDEGEGSVIFPRESVSKLKNIFFE